MVIPVKLPYISERLNYRITNIFRKENIPVRIAHRSHTLRRALSHNSTERTCTRDKSPISNTKLCLRRNAVYQITCKNCIGSTTLSIHDRIREHLNNNNSSVKKHISLCQNKGYKDIKIKTIVYENDPANLRLFEAFYIRKCKPALNSREECSEFADLLFKLCFNDCLMIALILSSYISRNALFYDTYSLDLFIHILYIYISTR